MKVMTIANTNVQIVEHQAERVLTTEQLAQVYECEPKQVKQNFNNNKDRFIEGKHYYVLEGQDLRDFKNKVDDFDLVGKNANILYLWTRRGASRHCKMLGTDKAWEMFDTLEESYFTPVQKPMSQLDILVESVKALQEQERRLARTELDIADIKKGQQEQARRIDTLNGVGTEGTKRQQLVAMITAYARNAGITYDRAWRDFKGAYNTAFHTNISLSRRHYMEEKGLKKKPSVPEFLEAKELLDDALRIADKLLSDAVGVA